MSDLGAFSMWDLFRSEVDAQMRVFTDGLLALERGEPAHAHLASTMRAAHSIKGAGRIVQLDEAVSLAHAMEDCLVAAQEGVLSLQPASIDVLLSAGDLLSQLSQVAESAVPAWVADHRAAIDELKNRLAAVRAGNPVPAPGAEPSAPPAGPDTPLPPSASEPPVPLEAAPGSGAARSGPAGALARSSEGTDRTLKVGAQTLNRLMGLAEARLRTV